MQTVIKNLYKVKGLFTCKHPVHEKFDFEVSPFHVLKHKKCLDEGCVEFLWRCNIGIKGKKCPRDYKHVGHNCFSCKFYYEEKICRIPNANISREESQQFRNDFDDFEFWLSTVENKRIQFTGEIISVLPSLYRIIENGRSSTRLNGFLIKFERGHIGYDLFDDKIYLRTGRVFLEKHQPAPGDNLEFEAQLINDRGRIVLIKPSHVDITKNTGKPLIDYSKALVGRTTGAIVKDDIKLCRDCPYGSLIDIHEIHPEENQYRRFYCLHGVEHAYDCPIRLDRILAKLHETSDT